MSRSTHPPSKSDVIMSDHFNWSLWRWIQLRHPPFVWNWLKFLFLLIFFLNSTFYVVCTLFRCCWQKICHDARPLQILKIFNNINAYYVHPTFDTHFLSLHSDWRGTARKWRSLVVRQRPPLRFLTFHFPDICRWRKLFIIWIHSIICIIKIIINYWLWL